MCILAYVHNLTIFAKTIILILYCGINIYDKELYTMKIKVIIMDIDGTLTNSEKKITPRTKEVLMRMQERGAKLVLASGRPTAGLLGFAKELEMDKHHGLLVAYNGSAVTDAQTGEVLFSKRLSAAQAQDIIKHLRQFSVHIVVYKGDNLYTEDVNDRMITVNGEPFDVLSYEEKCCCMRFGESKDLVAFADYPMNKILTAGDPEYLAANHEAMSAPFAGEINSAFTSAFYYEFTAKGIDKAEALDSVLIPMGYTREEMAAFGDGQNDISMIKYAGLGVAMANADDAVKAAADTVTLSNEEDGIAHILEQYMD